MAKIKNAHFYGTPEKIRALKEEADWIGRHVSRIDPNDPGHLIVYAIAPKRNKPKKKEEPKVESETQQEKTTSPRRGNGFNRYREFTNE